MVSTDPIADMFSRIRNAIAVNSSSVDMPHSNIKEDIAKVLVSNGFLSSVKVKESGVAKKLEIIINPEASNSVITSISRQSRPGRRIYVKNKEIPMVKRGRGIVIVSTSKGLMTGEEAKLKKLGGELIGEVY